MCLVIGYGFHGLEKLRFCPYGVNPLRGVMKTQGCHGLRCCAGNEPCIARLGGSANGAIINGDNGQNGVNGPMPSMAQGIKRIRELQ